MEKLGIPTVTIVSSRFISLAKIASEGRGAAGLCFVEVPHPFELISKEQVEAKADVAFPEIIKAATQWKVPVAPQQAKPYPAETVKFTGNVKDVEDFFFDKGWSMGVPFIPPTKNSVAAMLKGTTRRPDELLWVIPPRGGLVTVEEVAVHAVMAGAEPEYMPVIIAIIEMMRKEEYHWVENVTTSPVWPVVIVNGPIVKEIGIAYSTGTGGRDHKANIAIGLTISSIVDVIGGSKYPVPNMSPVGNPAEIVSVVMGENEDELPEGWEPFHVETGYKKTDSVVSVGRSMGFYMLGENGGTVEDMLWSFAKTLSYAKQSLSGGALLLLPPQPAAFLARAGWTKDRIREYLWENARSPASWWRRVFPKDGLTAAKEAPGFAEKYGPITPDTLLPTVASPEMYKIVVTGGPGSHSFHYKQTGQFFTNLIKK
ncbi:UGSC family (seleno)protein [Chloroflexota bacterium]